MEYLRTPPHNFDNLARYPFLPRYVVVDPASGMRMHFVCEGKPDAPVVLMLHGEPTWSFLYRRLITMVAEAGYRVIAPDLIGFGRSDKPTEVEDYSYAAHLGWLSTFLDVLRLDQIALVCHDWGGLLGLSSARCRTPTVLALDREQHVSANGPASDAARVSPLARDLTNDSRARCRTDHSGRMRNPAP